jgi:Spherulation-specific family 4
MGGETSSTSRLPDIPVVPPDFELSIMIDAPSESQVLHPSNLPVQIRGSVTADLCTVQHVEVRFGASGQFQPAVPARPRDWSAWSFSGTPSPALGPVRVTARATGFYLWGTRRVPIRSETSVMVLIGSGIALPAFWTLDAKFQPYWQSLVQAGSVSVPSVTVIDGDWPATAKNNPAWKLQAQTQLNALSGAVLGYVSTRAGTLNILPTASIMASVDEWYGQFGQNIHGIYLDELVLPEVSNSINEAKTLVSAFRTAYPAAKLMILAGQCLDEYVVGPSIDWVLLWEADQLAYQQNFAASDGTLLRPIPPWWKNPANRNKIAHVVHDCSEPDRQLALGLSNERNAGHVFVMDQRGLDPHGAPVLYDHLPPYWDVEVREVNSFYDFGFDPLHALLAARRYGLSQGKAHAWPNFEAAWYPSGHVRGTFLLDAGPHATQRDVLQTDLPGSPQLFDIPQLWQAAHAYARAQGFETALPTFEQIQTSNGPAFRLILLATGQPWLSAKKVPLTSTYQQPTFAEPASVVRNVGRWAGANGFVASFPIFVPDDPANPRGRTNEYNCYVLSNSAPVSWRDVPTSVYLQQL